MVLNGDRFKRRGKRRELYLELPAEYIPVTLDNEAVDIGNGQYSYVSPGIDSSLDEDKGKQHHAENQPLILQSRSTPLKALTSFNRWYGIPPVPPFVPGDGRTIIRL